jgi:hypothetical protein
MKDNEKRRLGLATAALEITEMHGGLVWWAILLPTSEREEKKCKRMCAKEEPTAMKKGG